MWDTTNNKRHAIFYKTLQTVKYTEHNVCHILGMLGADTSWSSFSGRSTIRNEEVLVTIGCMYKYDNLLKCH